uniref:Uncharacterized protein n=1 Tax=Kalanchoe fedtschenkoi TaxID=63787 RepID=A0A7N0TQK7_KALFE
MSEPSMKFPLRWESTGDQWWFASPIDWAAANGHYDLVRQLLLLDSNHLIKLTSLKRTRRLETVWDDEDQFHDVTNNRSKVARRLFVETDNKRGKNSLIRAGYGGWLLYTAASAGDLSFAQELLERDPLLIFGEGEYGVTDILYAAAKSKNSEVFKVLLDFAVSPRFGTGKAGEYEEHIGEVPSLFKDEMMKRAVFAAARGGNADILKELLSKDGGSDVLAYRDAQGSTILHAAASKGQVEVVKYLAEAFDICDVADNQGNTALHIAAYRGQSAVVESLITASPSSVSLENDSGETYLHMAVSGFQTHAFRRMDRQVEFLKQLVHGKIFRLEDIVNEKNKEGQTVLHTAIIGNIHADLVQLLMSIRYIDVNARDLNLMTPLDHLKRRPRSPSSDMLSNRLVSAGGIFSCQDHIARQALASRLRMEGNYSTSPGTTFRISDTEIFLYTGHDNLSDTSTGFSGPLSSYSPELTEIECPSHSPTQKAIRANHGTTRLSGLLEKLVAEENTKQKTRKLANAVSAAALPSKWDKAKETPMSLRQKYLTLSSSLTHSNKRTLSFRGLPSPASSAKKKLTSGLRHGIMQALPKLFSHRSLTSSAPPSLATSPKHSRAETVRSSHKLGQKLGTFNKRLKFCFGPTSLSVVEGTTVTGRQSQGTNTVTASA